MKVDTNVAVAVFVWNIQIDANQPIVRAMLETFSFSVIVQSIDS